MTQLIQPDSLHEDETKVYFMWRATDNRYITFSFVEPAHDRWTETEPPQWDAAIEFPYWTGHDWELKANDE